MKSGAFWPVLDSAAIAAGALEDEALQRLLGAWDPVSEPEACRGGAARAAFACRMARDAARASRKVWAGNALDEARLLFERADAFCIAAEAMCGALQRARRIR